jgi:hypothetical protein
MTDTDVAAVDEMQQFLDIIRIEWATEAGDERTEWLSIGSLGPIVIAEEVHLERETNVDACAFDGFQVTRSISLESTDLSASGELTWLHHADGRVDIAGFLDVDHYSSAFQPAMDVLGVTELSDITFVADGQELLGAGYVSEAFIDDPDGASVYWCVDNIDCVFLESSTVSPIPY